MRVARGRFLPVLPLLLIGAVLTGCGEDDPFAPPEPARVEISASADSLFALGDISQLTARAFDANDNEILDAEFEWSCSNCDVASVVSSTGAVTAQSNGIASIRASVVGAPDVAGDLEIAVFQVPTSISVTPADPVLNSIGGTQQFAAEALDANGNPLEDAAVLWLSGDHRVATISPDGIATATGPGTATITAAVQGVPGATSLTVNQNANQLAFRSQPSNATAGGAISPAVQIEVQDADGNRVTSSTTAITLSLASGPGTLGGTYTVNAVDGVATFSGLWLDRVGTYSLSATASGIVAATSADFDVSAGAPALLSFTAQPTSAEGNEPIALEVTITDEWDNVVPGATNEVTIRFDNNPTGADLLGSNVVNASSGVATFSVRVDQPGTDYAFQARAEGLRSAISSDFDVSLTFTQLASGPRNFHSCGITVGGHAYCWGQNWAGQLGDGTTEQSAAPVLVTGDLEFIDISAGDGHTCAVATNNRAYCWGYNWAGQVGDGSTTNRSEPTAVSGSNLFREITAGLYHTCALRDADDVAMCWGWNGDGQLGNGTTTDSNVPAGVTGSQTVFATIDAGGYHTCAIANDLMYCWGRDSEGQVGNGGGSQADVLEPVQIAPTNITYKTVTGGGFHTCATTTESGVDRARCWGFNSTGQLGDGSTTNAFAPTLTQVASPGDDDYVEIQAGERHTCAIKPDNSAYCWGQNTDGQLGIEDTSVTSSTTRVLVAGSPSFVTLGLGNRHSCAIDTDSITFCWGDGNSGQLGTGNFADSNIPVRVRQ